MGKKLFSMLLCLVAYAGMAFAQNVTVTGTVTEASNGAPIPGATVMIDGTLNGTSTDANGKYSISVSSIGKLVFSVLGSRRPAGSGGGSVSPLVLRCRR